MSMRRTPFHKEQEEKKKIYWTELTIRDWRLLAAATEKGLCFVGSEGASMDEMHYFLHTRFKGSYILVHDPEVMDSYVQALSNFLLGNSRALHLPFDLEGTPFQQEVWEALKHIPFGQTRSYSELAHELARPSAVRAVGSAIGANPVLIAIPCHRVLGKNGKLTGYRGGLDMKKRLLDLELK
ncbi:methylated-DNA--[protein]-cysteine S-methyltransferase [Paenibacillus aquistagni]|uniref:methylated-DNA--[protein]-cysteine S-methyltransferase n=1 Tax=Paenibacillus aquistagni TaxID=1852522 RepID=A0A1X7LI92_9BACL|nr:methylated-DNA--[protein]-cysteine S-methyltransferase [Paenibacillus aquistagni]SMG52982.1 methylated-DNA-[protein]-cysteine S-methyltransferase [Paenibacillus aquistagni]